MDGKQRSERYDPDTGGRACPAEARY
jgi:hypothetical protein